MGNLGTPSKPLLGLLAATVIVALLWIVALKPSAGGGGAPAGSRAAGGLGAYQGAIDKARASAAAQNHAAQAGGARLAAPARSSRSTGSTAPAPPTMAAAPPARAATPPTRAAAPSARAAASPARAAASRAAVAAGRGPVRVRHARIAAIAHPSSATGGPARVASALRDGRVVAILFYNPGAADDRAERAELLSLPPSRHVLRLAVPIAAVAQYPQITRQLPIGTSPTLVIVDPRHQATVITGFASAFEIAGRIAQALSVRPAAA